MKAKFLKGLFKYFLVLVKPSETFILILQEFLFLRGAVARCETGKIFGGLFTSTGKMDK